MGVASIFSGEQFFQKMSKNIQKIFKNIQKNFRDFLKVFLRKLQTMHNFRIFFKYVNKLCVHFLRVWTQNTNLANFEEILKFSDENSIEKLNVYFIFQYLLLNIEPPEITPFSTTIFPVSV